MSSPIRTREVRLLKKPVPKTTERLPWPRMSEEGTPLGIDVAAKQMDIVKIVHKYFKVKDVAMDELLQEVFLAIVHKNCGKSAHDPRKSSFGHYVYMVANNVCINLVHRKRRQASESESLDAPNGPDDSRSLMDTYEPEQEAPDALTERIVDVEGEMRAAGLWDAARYLRAVRTGANPDIIREALSFGERTVTTKTIRDYRNQVREFVEG